MYFLCFFLVGNVIEAKVLRALEYEVSYPVHAYIKQAARFVRSHTMEVAVILLSALSIAIALYAPRIITFIRALYILRNVPSPPSSGLLSGHTSDLTTLKR